MGAFNKHALFFFFKVLEGLAVFLWLCLFPALLKAVQSCLALQLSQILSGRFARPF